MIGKATSRLAITEEPDLGRTETWPDPSVVGVATLGLIRMHTNAVCRMGCVRPPAAHSAHSTRTLRGGHTIALSLQRQDTIDASNYRHRCKLAWRARRRVPIMDDHEAATTH